VCLALGGNISTTAHIEVDIGRNYTQRRITSPHVASTLRIVAYFSRLSKARRLVLLPSKTRS
jgi:hypothetical protein